MDLAVWALFFRVLFSLPFAVFAGYSIHLFAQIAKDEDGAAVPNWTRFYVSQAINAIVGIVAATWNLGAVWMTRGKRIEPQSVYLFYYFIIDLLVLGALLTATAIATPYAPNTVAQCDRLKTAPESDLPALFRYLGRIKRESTPSACRRLLRIRILVILSMCVSSLGATSLLSSMVTDVGVRIMTGIIASLTFFKIALPPTLRGILVFTRSAAQRGCWPRRRSPRMIPSLNHQPLPERDVGKLEEISGLLPQTPPNLAALFRIDPISTSIASNLHFCDLTNISLASKASFATLLPNFSSASASPPASPAPSANAGAAPPKSAPAARRQ
ncbi:hypothetical protein EPUS_06971 [Endocarpon pusillum Z07020]|uniref:Uncharacterized protein n=1 Tax=Endocarpon pusillum (strain Z07020 / HMAS-L-300199) TaxID=1263415 RepID=U1GVB0_ENDPU|nr:uncharacterized protein EPUS_06971 [Endocarpon pusillum Z07020]ERF76413.1 hypothetical protein EPUS_06971 [Endocarpon pusillum Z07020]